MTIIYSKKYYLAASEINLSIEGIDLVSLLGENNSKLKLVRKAFPDATITSRGDKLKIVGDKKDTQTIKGKFETMVKILKDHKELTIHTVQDLLEGERPHEHNLPDHYTNATIVHGRGGKPIRAKTKNQKRLVESTESNDVVFAIGPAGTGKTFTAVALAIRALKNRLVKKIILTRPAVEAGESLGFLPGDLKDKVDPYLRPLYDALDAMLPAEKLAKFLDDRTIEIAPLAYMRGRTLDNAFIILDEAQNCTAGQIKMFLTRLGPTAKAVITGDLSQIDLPRHQTSGLYKAVDLLADIKGIGKVVLTIDDVVRHRLVREIIIAYNADGQKIRNTRENEKAQKEKEYGHTDHEER